MTRSLTHADCTEVEVKGTLVLLAITMNFRSSLGLICTPTIAPLSSKAVNQSGLDGGVDTSPINGSRTGGVEYVAVGIVMRSIHLFVGDENDVDARVEVDTEWSAKFTAISDSVVGIEFKGRAGEPLSPMGGVKSLEQTFKSHPDLNIASSMTNSQTTRSGDVSSSCLPCTAPSNLEGKNVVAVQERGEAFVCDSVDEREGERKCDG